MLSALCDPKVRGNECIVAGDLNINLLEYENACVTSKNFINDMFSYSFVLFITKPTRFPCGNQNGNPTLLDHIWYSRCGPMESGIILLDCTDHLPTFLVINNFLHQTPDLIRVTFRDHSQVNMAKFEEKCQYFVDNFVYVDVDNSTHFFCQRINQIYCNSFPLEIKHISHKRFKNT